MEVRRSPELEELANEALRAWRASDGDWLAAHTGDGEVAYYGTAPGEVWRGREEILALNRDRVREMNQEAGIVDGDDNDDVPREVETYEAGDTGVIVTHTSFVLEDGSSIPVRSVTVVVRDGGDWKTIFGGVHVVVPNELIRPGSPIATAAAARA